MSTIPELVGKQFHEELKLSDRNEAHNIYQMCYETPEVAGSVLVELQATIIERDNTITMLKHHASELDAQLDELITGEI